MRKTSQQARKSGRISVTVLRQNSFFSEKPQFLLLRLSADFRRSTYMVEGNFLYLKSVHCKC